LKSGLHRPCEFLRPGNGLAFAVSHREPATNVQCADRRRPAGQEQHPFERLDQRAGIGNLRADVNVQSAYVQARKPLCSGQQRFRFVYLDAELAAHMPGADVAMGVWVHAGIEPQRYTRPRVALASQGVQRAQLIRRFRVDLSRGVNAYVNSASVLPARQTRCAGYANLQDE
jgi:hypothetical protein